MKQKISKFLSLLLAAILLLSLIAPAALAAERSDTVYLRTAEDLAELSRNCTLDSWSQEKTVYLEADIDLTGTDFAPIPTFGGTLEGQGYTISGLSITGSGNVRGLFRYIQPTGAVRDLNVTGSISPTDRFSTSVAPIVTTAENASDYIIRGQELRPSTPPIFIASNATPGAYCK